MSTLQKKVNSRNRLKAISKFKELDSMIANKNNELLSAANDLDECKTYVNLVNDNFKSIINESAKLSKNIDLLVTTLTNDINQQARGKYYYTSPEPSQSSYYDKKVIDYLTGRLSLYASWKYPGLQFNVRELEIVNCMVASDPLYLIYNTRDEISSKNLLFSEEYQNRVRPYLTSEIDLLPREQFSLISCVDFANYISTHKLTNYLANMRTLLRPGGVMLFTYNNCELENSVRLVEEGIMSWNTETDLRRILVDLGYEIITHTNLKNDSEVFADVSCFEVRRSGELSTQKAHQVLGKIQHK